MSYYRRENVTDILQPLVSGCMTSRIAPCRAVRAALLCCVSAVLFALTVYAAEPQTKSFDVPAGPAPAALKQFISQSGVQLLYVPGEVKDVQTKAVKGNYTPAEAIDLLLFDTGLISRMADNGAISVNRAVGPNVQRVAQEVSDHPKKTTVENGVVSLDKFEVTGTRIRGVLGESTTQPIFTYSREDLARFGATTFTDLQRYIPQLAPTNWNRQLETALPGTPEVGFSSQAQGYADFGEGMRSIGNTGTLVLVDGRRLPKLGQLFATTSGYDLTGIPVSAIERIEVLTDGASAVYGADALAGVVNIILKKDYRGTEVTLSYTNTFDSDTAERRAQISHGFASGKLSLHLTLGIEKTNSMAPRDRWFSASSDKTAYGGFDGRAAFPGAQGAVRSTDGSNLPGLNSPQAGIPVNSTGANLTIADFASAPLAPRFDPPQHLDYGSRSAQFATLNGRYAIKPWLELFWNGSWRENTTYTGLNSMPIATGTSAFATVTLPANYPGNPFGVPLFLERALYEFIPLAKTTFTIASPTWLAGVRGEITRGWNYEAAVSKRWSDFRAAGATLANGQAANALHGKLNASVNNANAGQRIVLLHNALAAAPHPAAFYEQFLTPRDVQEAPDIWLYDLKADGPLWTLPAGPIRAAFGGEFQEDIANLGPVNSQSRLGGTYKRKVKSLYGEVYVPLLAEAQNVPAVHALSFNVSARRDEYSDFAGDSVPRYSVLYSPAAWLAIRASHGSGYKVPTLFQLRRAPASGTGAFTFNLFDPLRGGEAVGNYAFLSGGNPDLEPEESTNRSIGMAIDVPKVSGLSFSLDYYELEHVNRVASDTQAIVNYFPERLTRGAPSPEDIAAGRPGPIIGIDQRFINIASYRTTGFDGELRYVKAFASGQLFMRALITRPRSSVLRNRPDSIPINNRSQLPWRGTGYVFWQTGPWDIGTTATYTSDYVISSNQLEAVWLFDLQASYDFGRSKWEAAGWKGHVFRKLKLTAQVMNIFDREPQTVRGASLGNVDPRGRRYQVTLRKEF